MEPSLTLLLQSSSFICLENRPRSLQGMQRIIDGGIGFGENLVCFLCDEKPSMRTPVVP
jgi:hypothetical protein